MTWGGSGSPARTPCTSASLTPAPALLLAPLRDSRAGAGGCCENQVGKRPLPLLPSLRVGCPLTPRPGGRVSSGPRSCPGRRRRVGLTRGLLSQHAHLLPPEHREVLEAQQPAAQGPDPKRKYRRSLLSRMRVSRGVRGGRVCGSRGLSATAGGVRPRLPQVGRVTSQKPQGQLAWAQEPAAPRRPGRGPCGRPLVAAPRASGCQPPLGCDQFRERKKGLFPSLCHLAHLSPRTLDPKTHLFQDF